MSGINYLDRIFHHFYGFKGAHVSLGVHSYFFPLIMIICLYWIHDKKGKVFKMFLASIHLLSILKMYHRSPHFCRYRDSRSRSPVRKKHRSSSRSPRRGGGAAALIPPATKKHNINNASRLMQLANYSADTIKEVQYKLTRK